MFSPGSTLCQETAGFLFSRPCRTPATLQCASCGKPLCLAHARVGASGPACVTCRHHEGSRTPAEEDDPYAYSGRWYSDYSDYGGTDHYSRADRQAFEPSPAGPSDFAGSADGPPDEAWESDFDAS